MIPSPSAFAEQNQPCSWLEGTSGFRYLQSPWVCDLPPSTPRCFATGLPGAPSG